jgi:probable rRNA maturation factor
MITIDLAPRSTNRGLSISGLSRFLNRARAAVKLKGDVDVLLTGDSTLRQLNKNFRGKDKPTDVLSFPAPSEFAKKHAGDLAISLETAARQATTYGHILRDEVRILILHGLLHLTGEDHETDNGEMATREAALRSELRLPATLIERTAAPGSKQPSRTTKKTSAATKTTSKTAKTAAKKIQSRAATGRPSTARSKRGGK